MRKILKKIYYFFLKYIWFLKPIYETRKTVHSISLKMWFIQKILGINRNIPWPVHYTTHIDNVNNIKIGVCSSLGDNKEIYVQAGGKIRIGNYTRIAAYSKLISSNHSIYDHRKHNNGEIIIGDYCWVGIGSIILPDVILGNHTVVAAGSIVTKSFPEGYCVIAGVPAKIVKKIEKEKCFEYKNSPEYVGYTRLDKIRDEDTFYNDK